jgi:hypothetical protein
VFSHIFQKVHTHRMLLILSSECNSVNLALSNKQRPLRELQQNMILHFVSISSSVSRATLMFYKTYQQIFTLQFYSTRFQQCGYHQVLAFVGKETAVFCIVA